jgi:hypothetical protein
MTNRIKEEIEYWKNQEQLAIEKRKTETFLDAFGFTSGPGVEKDSNGFPVHFVTHTDSARGAFIQWYKELEKAQELFNGFRLQKDQYLTEEAIAAAEDFYMDSISHHTGWGIGVSDWLITIERGTPGTGIKFELIRHPSVHLTIHTNNEGKFYIWYREMKNLKDTSWRLSYKNPPVCVYDDLAYKPLPIEVANHMVRRVIQHKQNTCGMSKKWNMYFKDYYSAQRFWAKENGTKYNPWKRT